MKHLTWALYIGALLCVFVNRVSLALPQEVKVAKAGETSLRAVLNGKKVQITFRTVSLSMSDRGFPFALKDYNGVSIVQEISIFVDGKRVWVPRSAYADLFNATVAELRFDKGVFELLIGGAGGTDTYSVHV